METLKNHQDIQRGINELRIHPKLMERAYPEDVRGREGGEFHRDYTRIMYSAAFRRLQGKMQLLGMRHHQFFRNRLTHSLEVAQIARSIAYHLGYDAQESYIVEGAALAHDLGNPPFGHSGESRLNDLFIEIGGFEGNAQTLRILTTLERKKNHFLGLNLTYRSLFSVVKYFQKKEANPKKFIYQEDYEFLETFIKKYPLGLRTLDVQIIDLADEIAYAAHDLEDGLRGNLYSIDDILQAFYSLYPQKEEVGLLEDLVYKARKIAGFLSDNRLMAAEYHRIFRQELTSLIINCALEDIDLIPVTEKMRNKTGTSQGYELGLKTTAPLIHGLKDVVYQCMNYNDDVFFYEQEGNKALTYLVDVYRASNRYLPPEYRAELVMGKYPQVIQPKEILQERLICDYISGMMDSFAITQYERFSGKKFKGDR